MLQYSRLQLTTIVAVPIVTIVLLWTVVVFYRNRARWRCYDLTIVAILAQSVLRNVSVISYTVLQMADQNDIRFDYCSVFVWIFNSIHTFQASTLATLAVIGLFSVKLHRRRDSLKNYLTSAHVVYHLFCLTTLCACVGVAAILAKRTRGEYTANFDFFPLNLCKFMPYEMDVKYSVFVVTLHVFLACISLVSFVLLCYHFCLARRRADGFDYVKKSNSDLSELSLGLTASTSYYDTYSVPKSEGVATRSKQFQGGGGVGHSWTCDNSNISTTVSSTNSRRPCLNKSEGEATEEDAEGVGLETILPILTVCYLFNHLPVIALCLFPWVLAPWSVATAALCLGLLQDILVPLSLGLVDARFCKWISNVYRCDDRQKLNEKLPQVGLDGKFRPFTSQTRGPDAPAQITPDSQRVAYQPTTCEPKFPITNGSLYTSIDGRLPIIHNYRRHKDRGVRHHMENNLITLGAHATYLRHQQEQGTCATCDSGVGVSVAKPGLPKTTPGVSDNFRSLYSIDQHSRFLGRSSVGSSAAKKTLSQSNLREQSLSHYKQRASKSHDGLDKIVRDLDGRFGRPDTNNNNTDSEEDYFTDSMNMDAAGKSFDSMSSRSSFSITTEANCDFDFYKLKEEAANNNDNGNDDNLVDFVAVHRHRTPEFLRYSCDDALMEEDRVPKVLQTFKPQVSTGGVVVAAAFVDPVDLKVARIGCDLGRNFKIKRSNSKRSLENFRAFVSDNEFGKLDGAQRSFSYVALDETTGGNLSKNGGRRRRENVRNVGAIAGGSVPDFKKVFISDYL